MKREPTSMSPHLLMSASSVAYTLALLLVYRNFIAPSFTYLGYTYADIPLMWLLLALGIIAGLAFLIPTRVARPSDLAVIVLFILVAVPSVLMSFAMGRMDYGSALGFSLLVVGAFAAFAAVVGAKKRGVSRAFASSWRPDRQARDERVPVVVLPKLSHGAWTTVLVSTFLTGHAYLAIKLGVRFDFLAIADVYDVREEFSGQLVESPLGGYLVPWLGNALGPVLAVYAFYQRKWGLVGLAMAGQLSLYGQTGLKTVLFSLPAALAVAIALRYRRRAYLLVTATLAMVLVAVALDHVVGGVTLSSLLVRRFIVTPGALTALYYEFFSSNPFTFLSQSVLSDIVEYPYARTVPAEVGAYWTRYAPSANGNFLADGFSNFGPIGMIAAAVVVGVIFRLYDNLAFGLPIVPACLLLVMPLVTLSNSAIQTSLLTHGLAAVLLLAGVLPRSNWPATMSRKSRAVTPMPVSPRIATYTNHGSSGPGVTWQPADGRESATCVEVPD